MFNDHDYIRQKSVPLKKIKNVLLAANLLRFIKSLVSKCSLKLWIVIIKQVLYWFIEVFRVFTGTRQSVSSAYSAYSCFFCIENENKIFL